MTQDEWRQNFSDRLINAMRSKHINQTRLAEYSGLSDSRISDYIKKRATPTVYAVINIADALDMRISELVDFDERIV